MVLQKVNNHEWRTEISIDVRCYDLLSSIGDMDGVLWYTRALKLNLAKRGE